MSTTTAKAALDAARNAYFNSDPVGPVELDRRRTAYHQARIGYDIALARLTDAHLSFPVNRGAW